MVTNHPQGIASTILAKGIKITQKSAWFVLHLPRLAADQPPLNFNMGFGEALERFFKTKPEEITSNQTAAQQAMSIFVPTQIEGPRG